VCPPWSPTRAPGGSPRGPFSDAKFDELLVNPAKLAGIVAISREAAEDTNPAAADLMGQGLVRDLSHKLDTAFFGNVTGGVAPGGLGSLPFDGTSAGTVKRVTVSASTGYTNLDPFVDAQTAVQDGGGDVTAWVMNPTTLKTLRKIKAGSALNGPLLVTSANGAGVNGTNGLAIDGVPVFKTPFGSLPDGAVWGVDASRVVIGLRDEVQLDVDKSVLFTSDRFAVRAIVRLGWKFVDRSALVYVGPPISN
jgi:HK97 family phage major capsid protein